MTRCNLFLDRVIGEAVMVNSLQNFCKALEPMLRRVVNEELENSLRRCTRTVTRSPSLRIKAPEPSPSSYQLVFKKKLSLPIFTGSKIVDLDTNTLQIQLVDAIDGVMIPTSLSHPFKVEVVVLDGDFPSDGRNSWTSEEFDSSILKERTGKRPLLAGDFLTVTLREGIAPIGEIEFTDNSSWVRSRKFRLGARVVLGSSQGVRIREAVTDAFVVKDHRGECFKNKHRCPTGPLRLQLILDNGMSEKMWEVTMKHARTCEMGNKHYIFRGQSCTVTLNPICQVLSATINGQTYSTRDLPSIRGYIENLVRQAYANWSSLEVVVGVPNEISLLTQGEQLVDQYPNHHYQAMVKSYHQIEYTTERYFENQTNATNAHMGYINWQHAPSVSPGIRRYSISESSSNSSELTPRSYIN
ncbi:calmodulin binding protein, putative [Ricinus communis]|uniref:Calmodulin binding protein, putative n=1 Tax=Ricinus communis TaxID=3988 RepID=B9SFY7_RICCO|nr:calmodulin binding protein, putative [Ricinus communis]